MTEKKIKKPKNKLPVKSPEPKVKPKIKKTPFTGDVNLIFTNNSLNDNNNDDIEVEELEIISNDNVEPVYNHSVNYYSKSKEKINNLFAYNEYENLDFIKNSSDMTYSEVPASSKMYSEASASSTNNNITN